MSLYRWMKKKWSTIHSTGNVIKQERKRWSERRNERKKYIQHNTKTDNDDDYDDDDNNNSQFEGYAHECLILLKPSCFWFPSLVVRCYCNCLHRYIEKQRLRINRIQNNLNNVRTNRSCRLVRIFIRWILREIQF